MAAKRGAVELFGLPRFDIPLPARAIGIADPGLRLLGETAGGVGDARGIEPGRAQAPLGRQDLHCGIHLDPEMIERGPLQTFEEHQFQGRIGDREVRIAGFTFAGVAPNILE